MKKLWPQRWTDLSDRKHKRKLRPMDDITIEEARQILQMRQEVDVTDLPIVATPYNEDPGSPMNYISISAFDENGKMIAQTLYTPDPNQLFTPEEVVFFMQKNIDIFGYNKAGITIESRTRNGDLNN